MRQTRQAIRRARRARLEARIFVGPVITSIHEKRAQLRADIMAASDLEREPTLGRRRARDGAAGTEAGRTEAHGTLAAPKP